MTEQDTRDLGWSIPANLRWLAEQPARPDYTPCGALTGRFLVDAAAALETQATRAAAAEEERDALLHALGWRAGSLADPLTRKVILDDSAGLRSEMVKARRAAAEAEGNAMTWYSIIGEFVHDTRNGVLGRLWRELQRERRRRREVEVLVHAARIPYAPPPGPGNETGPEGGA